MNDYKKNDFFTRANIENGTTKYYLKIGKEIIEVSKDVYLVCHNSYQKQLRDMRRDIKNELISYDMPISDNETMLDKLAIHNNSSEDFNNYIDPLLHIIEELSYLDKKLIIDLFYEGKSEKEIADELGISQQAVNKKKKKILSEMKKKF